MSKPNPLAAAWTWSTRHSPLLHAAERLTRRNCRDASVIIREAGLPDAPAQRIAAIVRATRLWKSERAEIARELIAHAEDALAAGRTPEETTDALGDPGTVAPLLRRSAKRKRHWLWQARHRTLQALGISLLALISVYIVLFIRFNTGSPDIRHNYLAELNERNSSYTEDQKALPAFEALDRAWSRLFLPLLTFETHDEDEIRLPTHATERFPLANPEDRGYDELVAAHARVRPQIDAAIAASRRPVLGMLYSDRYEDITDEEGIRRVKILPPAEDPGLSGPVIDALLSGLAETRRVSQLIAFDAAHAALHNNPDRTVKSLTAILNAARLVGQEHTLTASLTAEAIHAQAEFVLLHILHHHPDLFNEHHLAELAHTMGATARTAQSIDLDGERMVFLDLIQRSFTDDGRGGGRLTPEGVQIIGSIEFDVFINDKEPTKPNLTNRLAGPVAMPIAGSRRDQREMYDRLMQHIHRALEGPAERLADLGPDSDYARLIQYIEQNPRYTIFALIGTALDGLAAIVHESRARTNATLTAIAVHTHRQRTGRWPDTLDQLVPHLLPAVPNDPFDPGRPIKYRLIDGVPNIYYIGANGIDNHATHPTPSRRSRSEPRSLFRRYAQGDNSPSTRPEDQGDWILYPPEHR